MTIIASCGHELTEDEEMGYQMSIHDIDRYGCCCIRHMTVCKECKDFYEGQGYIVKD